VLLIAVVDIGTVAARRSRQERLRKHLSWALQKHQQHWLLYHFVSFCFNGDCSCRVFKIFRNFASCIPTRKSKALETDDVAPPEEVKPREEDDAAKDTEEEEGDEVEEEGPSKPDAEEQTTRASSPTGATMESEDAPEDVTEKDAPIREERDGAVEEPTQTDPEEYPRDDDDETDKPVEEKEAQDGDEYQWEISCCGVDIPLSK
jgi:hypothetical protein